MTRIARYNRIKTLAYNEEEKALFVGSAGGTGDANE